MGQDQPETEEGQAVRHLRFRVISFAGNGSRVQRHMMGLAIGTAVLFVLAGTLGVLQADRAVAPIGGGTSAISGAQLVRWIAPELSYWSAFVQASDDGKTRGGSLLHLIVGVDPSRPRTFLSRELPGYAQFAGEEATLMAAGDAQPLDEVSGAFPSRDSSGATGPVLMPPAPPSEGPKSTPSAPNASPDAKPALSTGGRRVVFIYHTHPRESFLPELPGKDQPNSAMDAKVNVTLVGRHLAKALEARGIGTVVDTTDFTGQLLKEGKPYALSYAVSIQKVKEVMAANRDITFIFDVHRDAVGREKTTLTMNGKTYAKLYFIIGKGNPHWEKNQAFAEQLHRAINARYPGLSRGIKPFEKTPWRNGEYNQHVSPRALTVEIGGVENTLEECYRTAELFADVIATVYWDAVKVQAPAEKGGDGR